LRFFHRKSEKLVVFIFEGIAQKATSWRKKEKK